MTAPSTGLNFGQLYQTHGTEAELLPEGTYDVTVKEAKVKSSSEGSKPQLQVQFVIDGPSGVGRKLTNTFTVSAESAGAMRAFFGQMAALGLGSDFWSANPVNPLPEAARQVIGRKATVDVEHNEYKGRTSARVRWVNPARANVPGIGALMGGAPAPAAPLPVAAPSVAPAPTQAVAAPAPAAPAPVVAPVAPAAAAPAPPVAEPAPVAVPESPAAAPEVAQPVQGTNEPVQAPVPAAAVAGPPPAVPF
jgi:hypothetical protein